MKSEIYKGFVLSAIMIAMSPSISAQQAQEESSQAVEEKREERSLVGYDVEPESLSQAELSIIKRKREILLKNLYEEQELEALRQIMLDKSRERAFNQALSQKPTPLEILEARKSKLEEYKAENAPIPGQNVSLEMRTIDLDVEQPHPIDLHVAPGYASSIVFYDQSGEPWPIDGDIIGDIKSFNSKLASKDKHVTVFEITRAFAESNALINLDGLSVPLVIRLVGNTSKVDSRLNIRVPKFGPNAKVEPFVHQETSRASDEILSVLNGDRIADGVRYDLIGVPGEVTYKNGDLYIRTKANLLSPPWKTSAISPTGYKVYQLPPVTDLLFSLNGEMKSATIEKAFDVSLRQKSSIFE